MHLPCGTVQYRHSLQYSGYIPAAGYSRFSLLYTSSGFFEIWENHPIFSLWSTKGGYSVHSPYVGGEYSLTK